MVGEAREAYKLIPELNPNRCRTTGQTKEISILVISDNRVVSNCVSTDCREPNSISKRLRPGVLPCRNRTEITKIQEAGLCGSQMR